MKIESPGGGISVELADVLASVDHLDQVQRALIREQTIRRVMAETGESRQIVAEMLDAHTSMDEEAVLDLMEGQPTTLRAGLQRLAEGWHQNGVPDGAEYELDTLLAYPWPG